MIIYSQRRGRRGKKKLNGVCVKNALSHSAQYLGFRYRCLYRRAYSKRSRKERKKEREKEKEPPISPIYPSHEGLMIACFLNLDLIELLTCFETSPIAITIMNQIKLLYNSAEMREYAALISTTICPSPFPPPPLRFID